MKFDKDRESMVLENQGLIYVVLKEMNISKSHQEYEDLFSIGNIGLMKAVTTFNENKNIKFSSYACVCIRNEIIMNFRKKDNRNYPKISIDMALPNVENITLKDMIEDSREKFEDKFYTKDTLVIAINILLNCFQGKQRTAMLYNLGEMKQRRIAEKLNYSQSFVSRIIDRGSKRINILINEPRNYKEVYHMSAQGDFYKFVFLSKEIQHFNQIFAAFLTKISSVEDVPDFEILCTKERIIIKVQAHPQAFIFIAGIIQEVDEYGLKYISSSDICHIEENDLQNNKTQCQEESNNMDISTVHEESQVSENTEIIDNQKEKLNYNSLRSRKESKAKILRNYFLKLNRYFTIDELKKQFPELSYNTIRCALANAKKKGIIISERRGIYKVVN